MIMRIGDRIVEGRIQERETAKRQYEAAKRSGRKAGLVEQERPNIFTASVANIPPGESIVVEISYQQPVDIEDGLYSIRFPMVVNPRYVPESPQVAGIGGTGWAVNTVTVPDAERITPPMRHPAIGKANPVRIAVHLSAGMPVTDLRSPYHQVAVSEAGGNAYAIALAAGEVPADRDFVVEWRPTGCRSRRDGGGVAGHDRRLRGQRRSLSPQGQATGYGRRRWAGGRYQLPGCAVPAPAAGAGRSPHPDSTAGM
jgi:Ca-activated chloride channel family protein